MKKTTLALALSLFSTVALADGLTGTCKVTDGKGKDVTSFTMTPDRAMLFTMASGAALIPATNNYVAINIKYSDLLDSSKIEMVMGKNRRPVVTSVFNFPGMFALDQDYKLSLVNDSGDNSLPAKLEAICSFYKEFSWY